MKHRSSVRRYRTPKKASYAGSDWSPLPPTAVTTSSAEIGNRVWVPVDSDEAWQVGKVEHYGRPPCC